MESIKHETRLLYGSVRPLKREGVQFACGSHPYQQEVRRPGQMQYNFASRKNMLGNNH